MREYRTRAFISSTGSIATRLATVTEEEDGQSFRIEGRR